VTRRAVGVCAAVAAAFALTGCGSVGLSEAGEGDVVAGKELYVEKCGSCHVLEDAGTQGVIGPNLDDAFEQSRADGLGDTTIQSVVRTQIAYPVEEPTTGTPGMPADLVTGDDAVSVAAYVASVAGLPRTGQPASADDDTGEETDTTAKESGGQVDGGAVFAEAGCGSCHALAAANATGAIGPDLDEAKPSKELTLERVTEGMGAMPSFADQLSPEQIAAVADYVSANAGK
jgi:mono/diheme cytochrome c family protein